MREAFLLYKSFYEPIKQLSDNQLGQLFKALFEFQIDGEEPEKTSEIYIPFMFFKNQFRLDDAKYEQHADKQRNNGAKGGRPKKPNETQNNPENPPVFSETQKSLNDKDNVNVNVKEKENEKDFPLSYPPFFELSEIIDSPIYETIPINPDVAQRITGGEQVPLTYLLAHMRNRGAPYADGVTRRFINKIHPDEVWDWLAKFTQELALKDEPYKTLKDYQNHFINWLKIELNKPHSNNYENTEQTPKYYFDG